MITFEKTDGPSGSTRSTGSVYEDMAVRYLQKLGWRILERNFRSRSGEIDIIAADGRSIVFVEVKFRKSNSSGTPLEAVSLYKQRRISNTALFYLYYARIPEERPCRFDVIGIDGSERITHIKDAFYACI
ncbi:MAG: YraN family protein [Lachnospiraceae bacterium]|nr:YraN family protein [Lachnospiraceae bacterium]